MKNTILKVVEDHGKALFEKRYKAFVEKYDVEPIVDIKGRLHAPYTGFIDEFDVAYEKGQFIRQHGDSLGGGEIHRDRILINVYPKIEKDIEEINRLVYSGFVSMGAEFDGKAYLYIKSQYKEVINLLKEAIQIDVPERTHVYMEPGKYENLNVRLLKADVHVGNWGPFASGIFKVVDTGAIFFATLPSSIRLHEIGLEMTINVNIKSTPRSNKGTRVKLIKKEFE